MNKFQRNNLEKLATYLEALPDDYTEFDMSVFSEEDECKPVVKTCGSAACAIGHGPVAGIHAYASDIGWSGYAKRVFGVKGRHNLYLCSGPLWAWCFTGGWVEIDASVKGAAFRIRYYLANGAPDWCQHENDVDDFCETDFLNHYFELRKVSA